MPTLYIARVPRKLYQSLRRSARDHRRSIAAEVLAVLEDNIPMEAVLKARQGFFRKVERLRSKKSRVKTLYASTETMQRDDRSR
jgi:hypothetical protein